MSEIGQSAAGSWRSRLKFNDPKVTSRLLHLYGKDTTILESRRLILQQAVNTFIEVYGPDREVIVSRAPGRINLLGNHVDHRGGHVNYMAINRDTILVASVNDDDTVRLANANADRFSASEFRISDLLPADRRGAWLEYIENTDRAEEKWENYIRAPILYLQDQYPYHEIRGMDLAVAGDVPIAAGLSSSSTLVVIAFNAAARMNDLTIPRAQQAEFCGAAEWYVGTRGGSGDHAAILYSKRQALLHLRFFPLVTEEVPFPAGYRVVACNSCVEHAASGVFNERIATYEIGLQMIKKANPDIADRLVHLRDLNTETTGKSVSEIYALVGQLPIRASRDEIREVLVECTTELDTLFSLHPEPHDGYRIRQVIMFGIGECARSQEGGRLLKAGDLKGFGKLKQLSHDGDRQFQFSAGSATSVDNKISDSEIEALIADSLPLVGQSGGYDCSCTELDELTDIARSVEGCLGAGLTGGGLGGCVLALVEEDAVGSLVEAINAGYYRPHDLPDSSLVCANSEGACIV
ncbi:MAG: galactokinase family protein [Candidatus Latescibacterota bacterium]|nr:galactokinase family protein [Candidatus Latescibacterota bacterium]